MYPKGTMKLINQLHNFVQAKICICSDSKYAYVPQSVIYPLTKLTASLVSSNVG